ncbi:hypothetical protein BKA65DRAFT_488567 [Rhexocercosporidium sp. MPI-PUGE-AT-0058]|nr:hypothetical protein BKA65DRAFT_488567 [Rhexocercosporidium sp. MPI-PUGE-AT-0058]
MKWLNVVIWISLSSAGSSPRLSPSLFVIVYSWTHSSKIDVFPIDSPRDIISFSCGYFTHPFHVMSGGESFPEKPPVSLSISRALFTTSAGAII